MEGGSFKDYRIVKERLFSEENSSKGIPDFWNEYFENGLHEIVCGAMGVCDGMTLNGKDFKYGIGCMEKHAKEIPDGFEIWTIPAHTWAVLKSVGAMPDAIQDMWKRIYGEWLPQAKYELISDYDLEVYTEGDTQSKDYVSEIWIPVKEK